MRQILKSALLKTSTISDVKRGGGTIAITGLFAVEEKSIIDANHVRAKAEVVQVITVGASSYTPTGSTTYIVKLNYPSRSEMSNTGLTKTYKYKTPATITDLGATAALQREAIHVALVALLNATGETKNYVVAATLGTGTGFTITDDAGYFPARSNGASGGRKGATNVVLAKDENALGFATTDKSTTTAAVYSFGQGSRMNDDNPVLSGWTGNLVSGELTAPKAADGTFASDNQKYDAFNIIALKRAPNPTVTDLIGYTFQSQTVWVDNGLGTSTTNLTGFKAFEREFHKIIAYKYKDDPRTLVEFFDKPIAFQGPLGAAPAGTANVLGWMISPYGSMNLTNIGTQTIVAPVLNATGLLIDQDDTAGDGAHYSANQQTLGCQEFIVGKQEFSIGCRVVMGDWTDSHFLLGFRKKAVYTADYNDYTDMAAIGSGAAAGDTITTTGILNNAATVATASAASYADGVSAYLMVKVDINGLVTASVDGVAYPIYSTGTTALVLDADDSMIPFFQHVNIGSGDPAVSISEVVCIASKDWIA